jgi:hypothetical protein
MAISDAVLVLFFVIIVLGVVAWIEGQESFSKDPWFFPLLAALIMQILSVK